MGRLTNLRDALVLTAFLTGVLLPIRLAMYYFLMDHWVGSVGVMSAVMGAIIYFSYKGKLGYLGRLFQDKTRKMRKSKFVSFTVVIVGLFVVFSGMFLMALESVDDVTREQVAEIQDTTNVRDMHDAFQYNVDNVDSAESYLEAIVVLLLLPFYNWNAYVLLSHMMNELTGGWFEHLIVILFVDQMEALGILVYFRFVRRENI